LLAALAKQALSKRDASRKTIQLNNQSKENCRAAQGGLGVPFNSLQSQDAGNLVSTLEACQAIADFGMRIEKPAGRYAS
jgi:hypothetical protein